MANNKLRSFVREEGYCCTWAYLEAHKAVYTSVLMKDLKGLMTIRALQQNRAAYRTGGITCDKLSTCLKQRIKDGFPIPLASHAKT